MDWAECDDDADDADDDDDAGDETGWTGDDEEKEVEVLVDDALVDCVGYNCAVGVTIGAAPTEDGCCGSPRFNRNRSTGGASAVQIKRTCFSYRMSNKTIRRRSAFLASTVSSGISVNTMVWN